MANTIYQGLDEGPAAKKIDMKKWRRGLHIIYQFISSSASSFRLFSPRQRSKAKRPWPAAIRLLFLSVWALEYWEALSIIQSPSHDHRDHARLMTWFRYHLRATFLSLWVSGYESRSVVALATVTPTTITITLVVAMTLLRRGLDQRRVSSGVWQGENTEVIRKKGVYLARSTQRMEHFDGWSL